MCSSNNCSIHYPDYCADTEKKQSNVGFNYWPHERVVVKFDLQSQDDNAGDEDGYNLGIGYQF